MFFFDRNIVGLIEHQECFEVSFDFCGELDAGGDLVSSDFHETFVLRHLFVVFEEVGVHECDPVY